MIHTCEEHDSVVVYESTRGAVCPVCQEIEGLKEEISDLEGQIALLEEEREG